MVMSELLFAVILEIANVTVFPLWLVIVSCVALMVPAASIVSLPVLDFHTPTNLLQSPSAVHEYLFVRLFAAMF